MDGHFDDVCWLASGVLLVSGRDFGLYHMD
jgi:hypothetical protein